MNSCNRCTKLIRIKHRTSQKDMCPPCSSYALLEEMTMVNKRTRNIYYNKQKISPVQVNVMLSSKLDDLKDWLKQLENSEVIIFNLNCVFYYLYIDFSRNFFQF